MLIRILEPNAYFEKGIKEVPYEVGRELVSKGIAVVIKETAIDKQAHDSLNDARTRDQQ